MSKWTLFPADTDQYTVEIEDYAGVIGVTVGDITAEINPAEARHMAGVLMQAANIVEMEGVT
jgi:hypothetical protein